MDTHGFVGALVTAAGIAQDTQQIRVARAVPVEILLRQSSGNYRVAVSGFADAYSEAENNNPGHYLFVLFAFGFGLVVRPSSRSEHSRQMQHSEAERRWLFLLPLMKTLLYPLVASLLRFALGVPQDRT